MSLNDKIIDHVTDYSLTDLEQCYVTFLDAIKTFETNYLADLKQLDHLVSQLIADQQDLKTTLATIVRLKNNLPK